MRSKEQPPSQEPLPPDVFAGEHPPWAPPSYDPGVVAAIQALERGSANPHQQKLAIAWIINKCCNTYDLSYRPGRQGETDFAEGRRFVGLQLVRTINLKLGTV